MKIKTPITKLLIASIILIQFSSCASRNLDFKPYSFTSDSNIIGSSTAIFNVKSDRLVYLDEGIEKNAIAIKWCRNSASNNCEEYFHSYHCDRTSDATKCQEIEDQFYQAHHYKKPENTNLFPQSYGFYTIKPGSYYLGELQEIKSYKLENLNCEQELLVKESLEKRKDEIKQMSKDSIISKAFFYSGAVVAYTSRGGGGTEVGLVLLAGGGALMLIAMPINAIFTGDVLYIDNFKSQKSGWDHQLKHSNFISFEVGPEEKVYLGDISIHLIARGGYWPERRDGMIDFEVENNLQKLFKSFPEYKKQKIVTRLFNVGPLAGKGGAGRF